jgi:hypothetical protein
MEEEFIFPFSPEKLEKSPKNDAIVPKTVKKRPKIIENGVFVSIFLLLKFDDLKMIILVIKVSFPV